MDFSESFSELGKWLAVLLHHVFKGTLPAAPTDGPVTLPPVAAPNPPAQGPSMPAGVIGQPNADRLVQCQAAEDARAQYLNDPDPGMAFWAKNTLPYWWGIDEIAKLFPATDTAAQYVIAQCNQKMLVGSLNGSNENLWALFTVPKGETSLYTSPWAAGVVAGPNPLADDKGFKGIGLASLAAVIEANRLLNVGSIPPRGTTVPVAGPGGNTHPRIQP